MINPGQESQIWKLLMPSIFISYRHSDSGGHAGDNLNGLNPNSISYQPVTPK